ncbi:unnamed protein product, partial [marine sediment metagenome]
QQIITQALVPTAVDFLNPAIRSDDLSDPKSIFGRDLSQVICSDVVFADVRQRRGLGVGAELMWAKLNSIPVIALSPLESHYRRSRIDLLDVEVEDYVHPFVFNLSDTIVNSAKEEAAAKTD